MGCSTVYASPVLTVSVYSAHRRMLPQNSTRGQALRRQGLRHAHTRRDAADERARRQRAHPAIVGHGLLSRLVLISGGHGCLCSPEVLLLPGALLAYVVASWVGSWEETRARTAAAASGVRRGEVGGGRVE
jgi:hypothetical protein